MPKATRLPKHRGASIVAKKADEKKVAHVEAPSASVSDDKAEALSRGQRKRQAKRDQYLKREQMVMASLKLRREDEQKKRIDGLDSIREALLASVATKKKGPDGEEEELELSKDNMLRSNKSRKLLVQQEASQMSLVLQHPSFQADPLGTLKEHLRNTLSEDVKLQQKEAVKHAKDKVTKQAEKIALKKESGAKKKRKKFKATRSKAR